MKQLTQKSYSGSTKMNQRWGLQRQTENVVSPVRTAPCAQLPEVASKPDQHQGNCSRLNRVGNE